MEEEFMTIPRNTNIIGGKLWMALTEQNKRVRR